RGGKRAPRDRYSIYTYQRAIARGCEKATTANIKRFMADNGLPKAPEEIPAACIVPHWHPHQLRHNKATELRKQYGIEAARLILGHGNLQVTEIYAEADRMKAVAIMAEVG